MTRALLVGLSRFTVGRPSRLALVHLLLDPVEAGDGGRDRAGGRRHRGAGPGQLPKAAVSLRIISVGQSAGHRGNHVGGMEEAPVEGARSSR